MVNLKFVSDHCPCHKRAPCPDRAVGCHASCPLWAEWERVKKEEYRSAYAKKRIDNYSAAQATEVINRSALFRAKKYYKAGMSRYPRPSRRKVGGEK